MARLNIILAACMTALTGLAAAQPNDADADSDTGAKALFYGTGSGGALIDSGRKAAAPSVQQSARRAPPPTQMALMAWVRLIDETGGVSDVSPNRLFRSGERIRLHLKANRPGYLYVANIGTTGRMTMLFPGEGRDSLVKPGLQYEVPDKAGKTIRFDTHPGTEEVLVVLSPVPLEKMTPDSGKRASAPAATPTDARPLMQLAETEGAKDLLVEEDSSALFAARRPVDAAAPAQRERFGEKPLTLTLKLRHEP